MIKKRTIMKEFLGKKLIMMKDVRCSAFDSEFNAVFTEKIPGQKLQNDSPILLR
jgi:hypothetical protein